MRTLVFLAAACLSSLALATEPCAPTVSAGIDGQGELMVAVAGVPNTARVVVIGALQPPTGAEEACVPGTSVCTELPNARNLGPAVDGVVTVALPPALAWSPVYLQAVCVEGGEITLSPVSMAYSVDLGWSIPI